MIGWLLMGRGLSQAALQDAWDAIWLGPRPDAAPARLASLGEALDEALGAEPDNG